MTTQTGKAEHTPGPWITDDLREYGGDIYVRPRDGIGNIAQVFASDADARLIAAAPALLAALRDLLALFEEIDGGENDDAPEFAAARAAIRLVGGGE